MDLYLLDFYFAFYVICAFVFSFLWVGNIDGLIYVFEGLFSVVIVIF